MTGMLWAKWWTAILAATLLSLTILAARAHAQEPPTAPDLRLADWARVLAADPNLVAAWGVPDSESGPFYSYAGEPRIEGSPRLDAILYGDLDGDGVDEAVLPFSSSAAGDTGLLVYRSTRNGPQSVAAVAGFGLGAAVEQGALVVTESYESGAHRTCCAAYALVSRYQLVGDRLAGRGARASRLDDAAPALAESGDPLLEALARVEAAGFVVDDVRGYRPDTALQVLIASRPDPVASPGKLAFVFAGARFVGTDVEDPSQALRLVSQAGNGFVLAYAIYRPTDRDCCPSGGEALVRFTWDGERLHAVDGIPIGDTAAPLGRRATPR